MSLKRILAATFGAFFLIAAPLAAQDTARDDPEGASAFVKSLADRTRDVWSDAQLTAEERDTAFRDIFEKATDIELISRAMLGRHYRTATEDQRRRYLEVMRDYIISEFDKRMRQIGFKELLITGTTPAAGERGHLFVRTRVERDEGESLIADWRVRKENGIFQIVNLEIEGINLLITNREVFSARIKDVGLEGLITELVEETQEAE